MRQVYIIFACVGWIWLALAAVLLYVRLSQLRRRGKSSAMQEGHQDGR